MCIDHFPSICIHVHVAFTSIAYICMVVCCTESQFICSKSWEALSPLLNSAKPDVVLCIVRIITNLSRDVKIGQLMGSDSTLGELLSEPYNLY